ncbi:ketoacyl-ACP synthase III [Selenomonas sp. AB3002]|uniref:3-oxoacyl-ACP synthase III family protein n=1 Tax=Selenomonas sp. AB3002 TaxID=1392502 RepID=UPI00049671BC
MRYAAIRAVAGYLPPTVEKNDLTTRSGQALGIRERHLADGMTASEIAVEAAENLFKRYKVEPKSIDFVLICTQWPDYQMPSTACLVAERLGLEKSVGALDYNLGCSGYVYGLALAKGVVEAGMAQNLLLITASLYTQWAAPTDSATRPVFGDGATATLISAVEAEKPLLSDFVFGTDGKGYDKIIAPVGGSRYPFRTTPEETIEDDHGSHTNYDAYMDGQGIMYFTLHRVPGLVREVLEKAGLERSELDYCVFHQANHFMLEFVQKKCKLMDVPFFNDVADTGNTVSSTIPFGLESIVKENDPAGLRHVLLAGFGVGLSWAGCLADLSMMLPSGDS